MDMIVRQDGPPKFDFEIKSDWPWMNSFHFGNEITWKWGNACWFQMRQGHCLDEVVAKCGWFPPRQKNLSYSSQCRAIPFAKPHIWIPIVRWYRFAYSYKGWLFPFASFDKNHSQCASVLHPPGREILNCKTMLQMVTHTLISCRARWINEG